MEQHWREQAGASEVARSLRAELFPPGARVLVACSGGADSTALAAALAVRAGELAIQVCLGHVDHALRAGSGAEAERVRELAAALGVDCSVRTLGDLSAGIARVGLEAAARAARYEALLHLAHERRCDRVATAHTRRDEAETVLLRLARGAASLRGIARRRPLGEGVELVRPLLQVPREATEQLCALVGFAPVRDPHNEDPRRMRTQLRAIFPQLARALNPRLEEALAGAARIAVEEEALLQSLAREAIDQALAADGLDAARLAALPRPLLRRALALASQGAARPERFHLEQLAELVERSRGRADLPGGSAEIAGGLLRFVPNAAQSPFPELPVPGPGEYRWGSRTVRVGEGPHLVDGDRAPLPWIVRPRKPGDRFRPAGGREKKIADLWIDARVPRSERPGLAVLQDASGCVFWVERLREGAASRGAMAAPVRFEIGPEMGGLR